MAPRCADPRQIVITLNPTRRQELLRLVREITAHMISQLQTPPDELGSVAPEDDGNGGGVDRRPPLQDGRPRISRPRAGGKQAEHVQRAALKYSLEWRDEAVSKLEEIVSVQDTPKIISERKTRREALDNSKNNRLNDSQGGGDLLDFGDATTTVDDGMQEVSALQALYRPLSTRLTTIPLEDREEALSCVLVLLLSTGKYSAHSRVLVLYLASSLELPQAFLDQEEAEIAKSLMESSTADKSQKDAMSADAEAAKRRQENKVSRFWKVGLASVAGAAVIGVTGGLAAPIVAGAIGGVLGGVGLGGVASFLGIFWMNGALVGTLFGAYGAKMTGEMMDNYAKEVEDFRFLPLEEELDNNNQVPAGDLSQQQKQHRRLRVTIGINGWLTSEEDIKKPWQVLGSDTEVFALRYEMETLLALGSALQDLMMSIAWKAFKVEIIKRTVLATLWAALWPIQILAMASNIDNPFSRASNRSQKAGRLLADALINRVQGERPVTLVGYSLGATTIHACLQSLAERHAFGLVDTVVIIGTPAPSNAAHWRAIRTVVSGTIFNVYSENDMVLGFVYRMHSLALGVAGLQPIDGVRGVENLNLSERVSGHLRYASLTGEILRRCGFLGVKAGDEIEKDDVIQMKDKHAEGENLIDFGGDSATTGPEKRGENPSFGGGGGGGIEDDILGLSLEPTAPSSSPPQFEAPKPPLPTRLPTQEKAPDSQPESTEAPNPPPLPKRTTCEMMSPINRDDESNPPLPRRPTFPQQGEAHNNPPPPPPPIRRKPVAESKPDTSQLKTQPPPPPPPRLPTPETTYSDEEEEGYMCIAMVDREDDEDHDDR